MRGAVLSGVSKMVLGVSAVVLGRFQMQLPGMPGTLFGEVLGMVSGITLSAVLSGVSGAVLGVAAALRMWRGQSPRLRQGANRSEGGSADQGTHAAAVQWGKQTLPCGLSADCKSLGAKLLTVKVTIETCSRRVWFRRGCKHTTTGPFPYLKDFPMCVRYVGQRKCVTSQGHTHVEPTRGGLPAVCPLMGDWESQSCPCRLGEGASHFSYLCLIACL